MPEWLKPWLTPEGITVAAFAIGFFLRTFLGKKEAAKKVETAGTTIGVLLEAVEDFRKSEPGAGDRLVGSIKKLAETAGVEEVLQPMVKAVTETCPHTDGQVCDCATKALKPTTRLVRRVS